MKIETTPNLDYYEAVSSESMSCPPNIQHKGVQEQKKHTLEGCKYRLEKNEIKNGVNFSFRSTKHEI